MQVRVWKEGAFQAKETVCASWRRSEELGMSAAALREPEETGEEQREGGKEAGGRRERLAGSAEKHQPLSGLHSSDPVMIHKEVCIFQIATTTRKMG